MTDPTLRSALLLVMLLVAAGCGDAQEPAGAPDGTSPEGADPSATVDAMLALAEAGAWGDYVDRYYGEQSKFGSPKDRDALVERFEGAWGAKVLPALRRAATLSPRIEGDRALFEDGDELVFVLHRASSGAWTFHL